MKMDMEQLNHNTTCPQCGAPLNSQKACEFCGAIISIETNTDSLNGIKNRFSNYAADLSDERLSDIVNNPHKYEVDYVEAVKQEIFARANGQTIVQKEVVYVNDTNDEYDDKLGCWMWGLCFIIPLVGLIMFFVYRSNEQETKAKSAITAAIIGFVLGLITNLSGFWEGFLG